MAEYFAGGHLRFINGEWRDDNGDVVEIAPIRHGRWKIIGMRPVGTKKTHYCSLCGCPLKDKLRVEDEHCLNGKW